ncbi:hypothetical protein ACVILJ_002775 [Bradyrhizobium diazoefficiens]
MDSGFTTAIKQEIALTHLDDQIHDWGEATRPRGRRASFPEAANAPRAKSQVQISDTHSPRKEFSSARFGAPHAARHLVPARPLQGGAACRPQAQARIPQRHRDLPARGDVRNHPIFLGAGPAQAQPSRMRPAIAAILFVALGGIGVALTAFAAARARAVSSADFDAGFDRFRRARRTHPPAPCRAASGD